MAQDAAYQDAMKEEAELGVPTIFGARDKAFQSAVALFKKIGEPAFRQMFENYLNDIKIEAEKSAPAPAAS